MLVVATTWAAGHSLAGSLIEGQVNAILLVALCLTLWPPAGARWLGAAAVAAAFALKIWPGILWAEDLLRRRWRRLLASVALAGALVAVPLAVIACWLPGPLRPQRAGNFFSTPAFLNASLPGLALRLRDPARRGAELPRNWVLGGLVGELRLDPSDRILAASVSVTALAAGLALLAAARRSDNEPWQLGAALVALALVAAPVSWPHYPVLQLPGTAALANRMIARRWWWRLAALAACFLSVNWTEAIVVGPYVAAYGTRVVEPLVTWTLSTLPVAGGAGLFALQLGGLRDVQDAA